MNIADQIFDAVAKVASEEMCWHAIRNKQKQINSVLEKRCGNCCYWMKSSCKPEKVGKQFKSMASVACGEFELCSMSKALAEEWKAELAKGKP